MRTAIFGGTFDPIHNAHLRVAREAADCFSLDRVLFIPSGNPPHKPARATSAFEHRMAMVELACAADTRFVASRLEEGSEMSYSFRTIERVKAALGPGDSLFFLIGADAFAEVASWYRASDVLALVEFIVVSRPGYEYPLPPGARVSRLESLALPVSSSDIRRKLDSGLAVDELPPGVLAYIRAHNLYQS